MQKAHWALKLSSAKSPHLVDHDKESAHCNLILKKREDKVHTKSCSCGAAFDTPLSRQSLLDTTINLSRTYHIYLYGKNRSAREIYDYTPGLTSTICILNHFMLHQKEEKGIPENVDYALAQHWSFLAQPQVYQQCPNGKVLSALYTHKHNNRQACYCIVNNR